MSINFKSVPYNYYPMPLYQIFAVMLKILHGVLLLVNLLKQNFKNMDISFICVGQCDVALLPDIPGQYIFDGDTILPYQTVEVECLPGYYSFGNGSIECDADGEWNITGSVECLS